VPVLAFAEDVAASGGYMLLCAGDEVFVNAASIVGSLGVISHGFGFPKLLEKVLQPAAVRAGLGRVTWHQFRHIHSSLLNDLRVPVKIAQEQLGHASIQTTLNIYTHVIDASHRQAIEAIEGQAGGGALPRRAALSVWAAARVGAPVAR